MTSDSLVSGSLGASSAGEGSWSFLVWAPRHDRVSVRIETADGARTERLDALAGGYHGAVVEGVAEPPTYRFELPDGAALADPASRWQPEGVHGPSKAVDPGEFVWSDGGFRPAPLADTIIYELHVGTFSADGTFDAAIAHLDDLVELGVNAVEPMPVNAFPGTRNWGYDGAFPFAVQDSYGGPAGFQRFVDACHSRGLAVVLDVVYNHLGPEGTVLANYAPYFTDVYSTPWGAAVNVSEAGSDEVRRYFIDNAEMWVRDYHVDGLRFDAVHGIVDPTASPFLRELTATLSDLSVALGRPVHLIAESADNNPEVVAIRESNGLGFHAQWNDDFHHALHALLTGERDGYYQDYGSLEQLARAINAGFVFQGEYSTFRGRRHGANARSIRSDQLVGFAQNHDQIGNRAGAERLSTLVGTRQGALAAAVLLLSPFVPLLFMGEEYAEPAPFPYFVDHGDPGLLEAVRQGRAEEFDREADVLDPAAPATLAAARLDRSGRDTPEGKEMLATYQSLIEVRRRYPVLTDPDALETAATVVGSVMVVHRSNRSQTALAAYNFAADEARVDLPDDQDWSLVLDSTAELADGAITLAPYGYALCIAGDEK